MQTIDQFAYSLSITDRDRRAAVQLAARMLSEASAAVRGMHGLGCIDNPVGVAEAAVALSLKAFAVMRGEGSIT